MLLRPWILSLSLCAVAVPGYARAAVTADDFLVRNTGDLVALCSDQATDPMSTAALNFCHGFGVGVVRVLQEEDAVDASRRPMFCLPSNRPSRNEAVAGFVQWANASPSRLAMPATDGIAAYLAAQYPCPGKQ
jgi:hypothetical protein